MADPAPPAEVMVEFLRLLRETIREYEEPLVPVLRGSLLLRHWFGELARPAADIDLECFQGPLPQPEGEPPRRRAGRYGAYGEFGSLVDFGKAMCRYAAESSQAWSQRPRPEIEFQPTEAPADGSSLWAYGTPGQRYYVGWIWHGQHGMHGRMQIDIAQPESYQLDDIAIAHIDLVGPGGEAFDFPAYTPEMLLAAKLSWLLASFQRPSTRHGLARPVWKGEPKDLFDAHLLLTRMDLRPDLLHKSLLAIGMEDNLDCNTLGVLFDLRRARLTDVDFSNWDEFRRRHAGLVSHGPAELLREILDNLELLLDGFCLPEEMPFLLDINANPVDEVTYLIYADWLEERGQQRGHFLRQLAKFYFRPDELSAADRACTCMELRDALARTSAVWLLQLFGTSGRLQEVQRRIAAGCP